MVISPPGVSGWKGDLPAAFAMPPSAIIGGCRLLAKAPATCLEPASCLVLLRARIVTVTPCEFARGCQVPSQRPPVSELRAMGVSPFDDSPKTDPDPSRAPRS